MERQLRSPVAIDAATYREFYGDWMRVTGGLMMDGGAFDVETAMACLYDNYARN